MDVSWGSVTTLQLVAHFFGDDGIKIIMMYLNTQTQQFLHCPVLLQDTTIEVKLYRS